MVYECSRHFIVCHQPQNDPAIFSDEGGNFTDMRFGQYNNTLMFTAANELAQLDKILGEWLMFCEDFSGILFLTCSFVDANHEGWLRRGYLDVSVYFYPQCKLACTQIIASQAVT